MQFWMKLMNRLFLKTEQNHNLTLDQVQSVLHVTVNGYVAW